MLRSRYIALVCLSVADFALTAQILCMGGWEVNPLAALIINNHGMSGLLVFKLSITFSVIAIIGYIATRNKVVALRTLRISIIITALPVVPGVFKLCRYGWYRL